MTGPRARAISVDLDGTLYRVRRLRVAWRLRSERGLLLALLAAREKIRHEPPFPDRAALEAREAELVAPSFGLSIEVTQARLQALRAAMPAALTRGVAPFPGVESALMAAHVRGLKVGVLSDYDPSEKLTYLGLDGVPWVVKLSAEDHGTLKPHARVFVQMAEALGVDPSEVVHVGDREDVDVEGARAGGMRAWRFAPKARASSGAEHVFSRWSADLFSRLWQ